MMKHYQFDPKKFKIGLRTFKTGLAVFLILLLAYLLGWEGAQIAALTAVFSLRADMGQSVTFGFSRIVGNSLGGLYALLFYFINQYFQGQAWVTLLMVPVLTMLVITTNVAISNQSGIIGAVSAFLIITLSIPEGETFAYFLLRISETFIGVFVAILVNLEFKTLWAHGSNYKARWLKRSKKR